MEIHTNKLIYKSSKTDSRLSLKRKSIYYLLKKYSSTVLRIEMMCLAVLKTSAFIFIDL